MIGWSRANTIGACALVLWVATNAASQAQAPTPPDAPEQDRPPDDSGPRSPKIEEAPRTDPKQSEQAPAPPVDAPAPPTEKDSGLPGSDGSPAETPAPPGDAHDNASAPSAAPTPAVSAPVLVTRTETEYPAQALEHKAQGQVVLQLTINAQGKVVGATVVKGLGFGLDEAALHAVRGFVFRPATRDGEPMAARITYAYVFALPEPPAPRPPASGRSDENIVTASQDTNPASKTREPVAVTVEGKSEGQRLRESAEAVEVVDTTQARMRTVDLGEVLARTQGVGVRRAGGLGSNTRFSLNGLTNDQIRFFVDGLPIALSPYPFGIANIPVNEVRRVDIYRGVVPVRFGADALGGAVNIVSFSDREGTHASGSYQGGAFQTHRATLAGQYTHTPSGLVVGGGGFFDHSDNDYPVQVEVANEVGRLSPATVHRFHDRYRAGGANMRLGIANKPWARRLFLQGHYTQLAKELQHNIVMTVPYGEAEYSTRSAGVSLRYDNTWASQYSASVTAAFARVETGFADLAECVYNWFGQCGKERPVPGEIERRPRDQTAWDHHLVGRASFGWQPSERQALRLSLSPSFATRTGEDRTVDTSVTRDPLSVERDMTTMVTGIEYQLNLLTDTIENVLFAKDYFQLARAQDPLPGNVLRRLDRDTHRLGFGNSIRVRFLPTLYGKASYEWATRLPRPGEVFGNAVQIGANLELRPEISHNANLSLHLVDLRSPLGTFGADVNGFLRETEQLIVLLGNDRYFTYQNVYDARAYGVEGSLKWSSPGDYLMLSGNATWLDLRNVSDRGTFGDFNGDRIPNQPHLFANGQVQGNLYDLAKRDDTLSLVWTARYTHEFFRGWESVGLRAFKDTVPMQLVHTLGLVYLITTPPAELSFAAEVQNLTDEQAFDFFGVQRPGRAVHCKVTATLQ